MVGHSFKNCSIAGWASALTAAILFAALWLAPSATRASQPESGPRQVPATHDQDEGLPALSPDVPPPAPEAKDREEGSSTSVELTRWKLPVASLSYNTTAARPMGGEIVRLGAAARGISKHSLQVLFCTWQI